MPIRTKIPNKAQHCGLEKEKALDSISGPTFTQAVEFRLFGLNPWPTVHATQKHRLRDTYVAVKKLTFSRKKIEESFGYNGHAHFVASEPSRRVSSAAAALKTDKPSLIGSVQRD